MESEKLLSKDCNFRLLSLFPMYLRGPFADTNKHFAPVSTMEPADAGKYTSKILLGLLYYQLNCQQSSHSSPKGPSLSRPWLGCWTQAWSMNFFSVSQVGAYLTQTWMKAESMKQGSRYLSASFFHALADVCGLGNLAMTQQITPPLIIISTAY